MSNAGEYDDLLIGGLKCDIILPITFIGKNRYKIMKLKRIGIGLLMFAGVVAIFVAMPKQANAASDGNVSEQYATAVISEQNVKLGENVVGSNENASPFVNFTREIPGTTNWWHVLYNKWRRHGKR